VFWVGVAFAAMAPAAKAAMIVVLAFICFSSLFV
jgi:hypothetical protein